MIKVKYSSIDGYKKTSTFKTLAGAQKFAQKWVGEFPELGSSYAISSDGVGKITVQGVMLQELFPVEGSEAPGFDSPSTEWTGFDSQDLDY